MGMGMSVRNLLLLDTGSNGNDSKNPFSGIVSPKNPGVANANAAAKDSANGGSNAKYLVRSGSQRNILPSPGGGGGAGGGAAPPSSSAGSRFGAAGSAAAPAVPPSPSLATRSLGIGGTASSGTALSASAVTVLSFTLPTPPGHAASADPKPFHPVLLSIEPSTGFLWYSDHSLYRISPADYPIELPNDDPTGGWILKSKTYIHEATGFTWPSAPSGVLPRPVAGELHHPSLEELCRGRSLKIQAELATEDAIEQTARDYPLEEGWREFTLANGHDVWYWDSVHGIAQWSRPISSSVRRKLTHEQEAKDKITRAKREPFQNGTPCIFSPLRSSSPLHSHHPLLPVHSLFSCLVVCVLILCSGG